ncbi:hypothetical protein MPLA_670034 [Mesorhizobium sp. ORS 3359]|nr:hypothetical protein MPLA_670034 [Mesorhizobium sp. ORS 3359]
MAKAPTNMAKSVKDRLLNTARKEGRPFDILLVRFALERLLYRLSISAHRDRFVLKGGMLVTVWVADDNRVTQDADFLGHGDADPDRLIADFREIMADGERRWPRLRYRCAHCDGHSRRDGIRRRSPQNRSLSRKDAHSHHNRHRFRRGYG